tara:strand:- start:1802 stop:2251 length:450 start_codon:yes stop_codon:yes gene_type:complete
MAHFAELDANNVVQRVVVVGNDVTTANGPLGENDKHVDGESWCINFFKGGTWKQTSYNSSFRKQYAGVGYTFDFAKDKFIAPQPFPSWSLDSNDDWQAPVAYPTVTTYGDNAPYSISWDEDNQQWKASDDQSNEYVWDSESSSWSATGN